MSVQIPTTKKEVSKIQRQLKTAQSVVCLDSASYVKTLLVGREMLMAGKEVKAEIVKGYNQ